MLIVLPSLRGGGAERAIVRLLATLPRARIEPHLAVVEAGGALSAEVPSDVPVHDLGVGRVRRAPLAVARLARRLRPPVIFSTLGYLNLALLAARRLLPRDVRVVVREANTVSAALGERRSPGTWKMAYRLLYPRADTVVCPSRAVLEDLAGSFGTPRSRLRCIPNPIDAPALRRDADASDPPWTSPGPHVVAVGRLERQKRLPEIVEAFGEVARRVPGAELWILGEGREREAVESRARALGIEARVHLPGFVASPHAFVRRATLYVQGSAFEGLPNALLEALACEVPVLAVDGPGGTREVIAGIAGARLVPDLSALGPGIAEALTGPPQPRPSLPERFLPAPVAEAYAALFEELTRTG